MDPPSRTFDELLADPSSTFDDLVDAISRLSVEETIAEVIRTGECARLITRDELLAAGALDVPASWRKSLGTDCNANQPLFADLDDEGESLDADGGSDSSDSDGDEI